MNTRSLVVPSVLLQATLLVASGCATQPAKNAEVPPVGYPDCKVDAARIGRPTIDALSPAALTTRNDLFARLCSSPGVHLVDVTDPTLTGHLREPKGFLHSTKHGNPYPPEAQRLGYQGDVLVAVVVEVNGSVHDVTILESSGHDLLDMATLKFFDEARYKTPAMLDGRPVRALLYETFTWRLGPGIRWRRGGGSRLISREHSEGC